MHAWVEAWLPELGWVGFDPTNNVLASERHLRVSVGRDYADVPPTRGVFRGEAGSELAVSVTVSPTDEPARSDRFMPVATWVAPGRDEAAVAFDVAQRQQQQQ
jgi:transglutaminase-like putative cysteine protease